MKKICIVTGSRAEYGLLRPIIDILLDDKEFVVQVLVTGSHLSPDFGLTYKAIEADGINIDKKVEMLLSSDTAEGIVKSMGVGMISFADALADLKPDLILVLGDRYEIFSVVSAALIHKIPVAHLHGGEVTEGAYDESIRHAITKMSHLHFTSAEPHRNRVIQMGEQPSRVFNVGAIGLDNIKALKLLPKDELERALNITLKENSYLVTFHPVTMEDNTAAAQFKELLAAIDTQRDSFFIFTKANADTNGRIINQMIDEYVASNPSTCVAYASMGQLRYLSAMQYVTAVVGNSSSGIIEAPSFGITTINIGDRQKGRMQADSVINVVPERKAIETAFIQAVNNRLSERNKNIVNPYGEGDTARKIAAVLRDQNFDELVVKKFNDL